MLIGKYKKEDIKDGMSFTAKINGRTCAGKITIYDNVIFLCQDHEDGNRCKDKKGFKYSWEFDTFSVYEFIVHELELPGPSKMNIEPVDLDEELLLL